jgi:riboflavin kinase/FMN adenylyltransferase
MKIYRGISSVDDSLRGAVLSVGNFDGVHLGHQRILRTGHALARVSSAAVVAMTFEPHPIAILRPQQNPPRLTPWEEKLHQLERVGVDAVIRLDTDWPLLSLSADDFVRQILVKRIHPSYIVEGPNFGFGRGRTGNVETLNALASKGGFQVRVVEPYRLTMPDGSHVTVSSTVIRDALLAGDVEHAARCLGRAYCLVGRIVHGAGAGKKLGFPTINLEVADQLVPGEGVYAGWAEAEQRRRLSGHHRGVRLG